MRRRAPRLVSALMVLGYVLMLAPLVVVIGTSFTAGGGFDFPPAGLSLRWYQAFFAQPTVLHAFIDVSLLAASVTALVSLLLGVPAAVCVVRLRFPGRRILESLLVLPVLVPHLLLGVALYLFFIRLGLELSFFSLVIGHVVIATPYVVRSVAAGLVGLNPRLEEAAMSLGASRSAAFWKVALPVIRSSLVSGGIFAFIISFGDVNLALFLSGPGSTSLPVHIFSEIQWGGDPTIAAASVIQIVTVGLMLLLVQRIFRLRASF